MCVQAYGWSPIHTAPCCLSLCSHCVRSLLCLRAHAQAQGSVLNPLSSSSGRVWLLNVSSNHRHIAAAAQCAGPLDDCVVWMLWCALAVSQARFCGGAVSCSQYMVSGSMHTHLLLHQSAAATCASVLQRDLACAHTTSKLISTYMRISKVISICHTCFENAFKSLNCHERRALLL